MRLAGVTGLAVELCILDVLERPAFYFGLLIERQRPDDTSRRTDHERAGRDFGSSAHERVCADDRAGANFRAIENNGAHSDKHFVIEGTRVNDRRMTDRYPLPHNGGKVIREMNDGRVLDVGTRADDDSVDITAQNRAMPDAGFFAKSNIANESRARSHECARVNARASGKPRRHPCEPSRKWISWNLHAVFLLILRNVSLSNEIRRGNRLRTRSRIFTPNMVESG